MKKYRYDDSTIEIRREYQINETPETILVKLLNRPLTIDDKCSLSVIEEDSVIFTKYLPKNLDTDFDGIFPTGEYFVYNLSLDEMAQIEKGRFLVTLRIHNNTESRVVLKENLRIT